MMSRPDFIKKQVIVINSDKSKKIKFRNSNLIVLNEENRVVLQHPCSKIFIVFIIGEFSVTSVLIKNAKKHGVFLSFLNYNLKPCFGVSQENKGNFLLRKKQYFCSFDFEIAKIIIKNKISNQLNLMKNIRKKNDLDKKAILNIEKFIKDIGNARDSQNLLGIEGNASKIFFSMYFRGTSFIGRKPRAKSDILNLLFDIGYFYLFNFIDANLDFYGFDSFYGIYHKLFYQRKSLVCDLVEPFRCIVDKKIRKMINLGQINDNDFYCKNSQYFIKKEFNKKYSEFLIKEILKNKEEIFLYIQKYYRCFIKEKELNKYPNFLLK